MNPKNLQITFWPEKLGGPTRWFRFPEQGETTEKKKLLWLIKLRWLAIALFFGLSVPAVSTGLLSRTTAPWYLAILSVLILFNLLSQMLVSEAKVVRSPLMTCFQLAFDLLILTSLLAITGGFENPFITLFLLNASLAGLLIPGRLSAPFLLLAHTLLAALQFQLVLRNEGVVEPGMGAVFVVYHFLLFGFWLVLRLLGAYLERQNDLDARVRLANERQDRLRALGALAAGFSHEFASPLNVIKIRLERLSRKNDSEDLIESLEAIRSCERVIQQMNSSQMDVRDFQFRRVSVDELLRDIVESWMEAQPEARVNLKIQSGVESSLPPLNFSQVILNLLDNAFEANPQGLIRVELTREASQIRVVIEDEGPGFSPVVLRQKGEPFLTTKAKGTGLGLYVSELFAQSMGGALQIENILNRGASVCLSWPEQTPPVGAGLTRTP